jgi:hypothetical protein
MRRHRNPVVHRHPRLREHELHAIEHEAIRWRGVGRKFARCSVEAAAVSDGLGSQ